MKIDTQKLASLGLEPLQAKVYIAALELGGATVQALSRKAAVNRTTIYTFIDSMRDQGYLHETKRGKRKVYTAADPDTVYDLAENRMNDLRVLLPELRAIQNATEKKPKVTYYNGMAGIEEVYLDMIKDKQPITAYEDLEHLKKGLPARIYDWFPKARSKNDIGIKSISRDTEHAREFSKQNIGFLRTNKYIKTDDLKTDINIYGNKVALMDLRGEPPFCVVIENKHLADTMRSLWQQLWDRLD